MPELLHTIDIEGLRGIAQTQRVLLARPNHAVASGLTLIVGANNSGKSTIIEAIDFLRRRDVAPPFTEGRRNNSTRGRVTITYSDSKSGVAILGANPAGGGNPAWTETSFAVKPESVFVVTSRRAAIDRVFQLSEGTRSEYQSSAPPGEMRNPYRPPFGRRLVAMHNRRAEVDRMFERVVGEIPHWTIEPLRDGDQQHTLRFYTDRGPHPADGIGDGLVSLFFLIDALYDSHPGDLIAIDEPELSLHPQVQKRLANLLADFARDRQIVCATHSPYFADWQFVFNGAQIVRAYADESGTRLANLTPQTAARVRSLVRNYANPHVLGLDAREVFFLPDGVLLVEGQQDVIGYGIIAEALGIQLGGQFYGWGVGGVSNMAIVAAVLRDLGYQRVVMVLDSGQAKVEKALRKEFSEFRVIASQMPDVITKPAQKAREGKEGFLTPKWELDPASADAARDLLTKVSTALREGVSHSKRL